MLIPVDDPADPRLQAFLDVRERDLVGRQGRFVAEGEVVLGVAAGRGLIEAVLIDRKRATAPGPDPGAAGPGHAGLCRVPGGAGRDRRIPHPPRRPGHRPPPGRIRSCHPSGRPAGQESLVLALSGIGNHDNMGGLFRNAAAFGVGAVLLAGDCCDPLYRKAIRVSVGATLTTPFARFAPDADVISMLEAAGFEVLALSPSGRERLIDLKPAARTAVLLGSEGPGLSETLMARARTVAIPMSPGWDSLNVAVTGGIVLHHLAFAGR